MVDHEITDMLDRAVKGDSEAFVGLIKVHQGSLRALAFSVVRDPSTLDDVMQEAFMKAFRSIANLRESTNFKSWIHRIVYTTAIDEVRRRSAVVPMSHDEMPDVSSTDSSVASQAANRHVADSLGSDTTVVPQKPSTALEAYKYSGLFTSDPDAAFGIGDNQVLKSIAGTVALLRDSPNATFVGETFDSRPAWKITLPETTTSDGFSLGGAPLMAKEAVTLVVDQKSYFPLQMHTVSSTTFRGSTSESSFDITIHNLVVNPKVTDASFAVALPAGVAVNQRDLGAKNVALSQVKATVGYNAVVPSFLPDGYKLSTTTVAKESGADHGPTHGDVDIQNSDDVQGGDMNVVSSLYTNGLNSIAITTRSSGTNGLKWADPLALDVTDLISTDSKLTTGVFKGTTAHVVNIPGVSVGPHLWGQTPKYVFTVQGNVSNDDLIHIANSLR